MRLSLSSLLLITVTLLSVSCSTRRKTAYVSPTMDALAQGYIDKYGDMAVSEMKRTGIPASITLAQGIIESDYGRSSLATQANNHFGIKCHSDWKGEKMYHDDDRKSECFRRYRNAEESFRDHSDFLMNTPRYKSLFSLSSTDYKGWAHGLKKCGYATNPAYATLLIDNIEKFGLHAFDTGVKRRAVQNNSAASGSSRASTASASSSGNNSSASDGSSSDVSSSSSTAAVYEQPGTGTIVVGRGQARVRETNRVQYVIVRDGDTYESLAEEFQLLKWEIAKYNELSADTPLKAGQIIYLQPKRSKADVGNDTCVVREGDTMYLISQRYAVKLEALYKLNFMDPGTEPAAGKKIKLR